MGKKDEIKNKILELLQKYPAGLHYIQLKEKIKAANPNFEPNTIGGSILDLAKEGKVYKPSRGLYMLPVQDESILSVSSKPIPSKIKEESFYAPFAEWLQNDIEDVTHAIPLGGNVFKNKWGTPDVIGKKESERTDVIKGLTEIVSAEIKTDFNQLITAFGQACAYKLFSHKSYLVIPNQSDDEEILRLDSLCQIFGIGLVTFDANNPTDPDFRIRVRPSKHEPDLFYTNKYMKNLSKTSLNKLGLA